MLSAQSLIILFFFLFTGWFIAWLIIKILFWPVIPLKMGIWKIQGIVPASQKKFASKAGELIQAEFIAYKGLEEKLTDPQLIAKLRPGIEDHVDHFLQEKIKTVFPIISQFMGEKTINQFKSALLTEIDSLLPVLMKNYSGELKNAIRLDLIVEEKINGLLVEQLRKFFHANARKQINRFQIMCTSIGFIFGMLTILIIFLFNT